MTLKELVLANRSYRGYDSSCRLSRDDLLELVDHARFVPSGMNAQPLKFCVAHKEEKIAQILSMTRWAAKLKDKKLPYPGKEPAGFIVICHDTGIVPQTDISLIDTGIAAQTILLAAVERGLAGCALAGFDKAKLAELLSLPEKVKPVLAIAIGKPAEKIVLTEVGKDGDTSYYRDENDIHYVPKRSLEDIVLS